MAILSADLEAKRQDSEIVAYDVITNDIIWKGALLIDKGTGYADPSLPGSVNDDFLGVAFEKVDNTGGISGALAVRVYKTGSFEFTKRSTAVQTDIGEAMYRVDDQTVDASCTNSVIVGYVVDVPDSSHVRIRIDRAVQ